MTHVEIQDQKDNKLLDRKEVRFLVHHDGEPTPTRDAVRQALATDLDADVDRVIVHRLRSEFGRAVSQGYAKVYPSVERAKEVERRYTLVRNDLAEARDRPAKPKAEAPTPPEGGWGAEEADEEEAEEGEGEAEAGPADEGGDEDEAAAGGADEAAGEEED